MKVRETNVSESDKHSARVFFDALTAFYDTTTWEVLDAFARNGQLTVPNYMHKVMNRIDMWELGAEHLPALKDLQSQMEAAGSITIGDSYSLAAHCRRKYDMVVIDTPQGLHHDSIGAVHVEHFDFLTTTLQCLLKDRGVVVLYCNHSPYNKEVVGSQGYDEYAEYDFEKWMAARRQFYHAEPIGLSEWAMLRAYSKRVERLGFGVVQSFMIPCFSDVPGKLPYAFRLALEVARS